MNTKKKLLTTTSNRSTIMTSDTCEQHEGQIFTNFCSAPSCVKPLCPQCVQNHYDFHREVGHKPEMESFRTVKQKCSKKLRQLLQALDKEAQKNEIYQIGDFSKSYEYSLRKVREVKDMIQKLIKTFFTNLEEHMKKKMNHLMSDKSQLQQKLQINQNRVNEVESLLKTLQSNSYFIQSIQKIIKLDTEALYDRVVQQYEQINSLRNTFQISVSVEKTLGQNLQILLSKSILIGNTQFTDYNNTNINPYIRDASRKLSENNYQTDSKYSGRSRSKRKIQQINNQQSRVTRTRNTQRQPEITSESRRVSNLRNQDTQSIKSSKNRVINIIGLNTFKQDSKRKYLHFFQNDDNFLHLIDLAGPGNQFAPIKLDIGFKIPSFHKSISSPNGDLFLVGGSIPNSAVKSQKIYKYDFQNRTLIYCTSLKYGRSSHSLCFNNKYIYIVGGFLNNQVVTNKCQRFDITANRVEEIQSCVHPVNSFSLCSFNGRYIFKFGGVGQKQDILHYIERYDQKTGKWKVLDPVFEGLTQQFMLLSTSAAVQISQTQIMVMGGYDQNNNGYKQTYIFSIQGESFTIKDVNTYPLPYAEAFWNNTPLIQNKTVFALQNISTPNKQDCVQNHRRILSFDGQSWKSLN